MSEEFSKNFQAYTADDALMNNIINAGKGYKKHDVLHAMIIYLCTEMINQQVSEEKMVATIRYYYGPCKNEIDKYKANTNED